MPMDPFPPYPYCRIPMGPPLLNPPPPVDDSLTMDLLLSFPLPSRKISPWLFLPSLQGRQAFPPLRLLVHFPSYLRSQNMPLLSLSFKGTATLTSFNTPPSPAPGCQQTSGSHRGPSLSFLLTQSLPPGMHLSCFSPKISPLGKGHHILSSRRGPKGDPILFPPSFSLSVLSHKTSWGLSSLCRCTPLGLAIRC